MRGPTNSFIRSADGTRLAWSETGSGPPLVRTGMFMTDIDFEAQDAVWGHWTSDLSARFRYVRYDERGCGLSEREPRVIGEAVWIQDLDAVVRATGFERVALFGMSHGAMLAQGVAVHSGMDVTIVEPDVLPLQLQGPQSGEVMEALFGPSIADLDYYRLRPAELDCIPLVISRTGWSSELGYELYLRDSSFGDRLWETIMAAGIPLGLKPGHTSTIRRIEGGMLSYHADADIDTNPYELGLDRLVNLDTPVDFIGKSALRRIHEEGVTRKQVGLVIDGDPHRRPKTSFWPITKDGADVGKVTSAVYSPRLEQNIALAMVAVEFSDPATEVEVTTNRGPATAVVVRRPFYDPKKSLALGRPAS